MALPRARKRQRKSYNDAVASAPDEDFEVKPTNKKPARKSDPTARVNTVKKRASNGPLSDPNAYDEEFTQEKELDYCRELIKRMVSGPSYWARYVAKFKTPIDPVADNLPSYTVVVKKPMSLNIIKDKMDAEQYKNGREFEADVRLIFRNCFEYFTPVDAIWKECQDFENFFNNQWAHRRAYVPFPNSNSKRNAAVKAEAMT